MNRLRRLPELIVYLGLMNFLLFILSILLLGGDGLNGKVEAGHYYLGNHGEYTEVLLPIYLFSRLWGILLFVSWPFVIVAPIISWAGGGTERDDEAMRAVNLGSAYGLLEGFFSRLFDSWRRPDLEFFTRYTESECIKELILMPAWTITDSFSKEPLNLIWGGHNFELSRYTHRAWRGLPTPLVLHGRFRSTPYGTYVKAWYRLPTMSLLFFSILSVLAIPYSIAGIFWLIATLVLRMDTATFVETIAPLGRIWAGAFLVIGLLLLIAISARLGRHRRRDLARLVKEALTPDSLAHPTRSSRDIRQLT